MRRHILTACSLAALIAAIPAQASETIGYSYDALGRLVKVARSGTVNNGATECYAYDRADNRSNVTVATASDCTPCSSVVFSVSDAGALEGSPLVFTVSRTGSSSISCSVNYATSDGTATKILDYTAVSGTLTFAPNQTTLTVTVNTKTDRIYDPDETVFLTLSAPTGGADMSNSQGVGTITDTNGCGTTC